MGEAAAGVAKLNAPRTRQNAPERVRFLFVFLQKLLDMPPDDMSVCCWRKLWACILAQIADEGDELSESDLLSAGSGYGGGEASSPLRGSLR